MKITRDGKSRRVSWFLYVVYVLVILFLAMMLAEFALGKAKHPSLGNATGTRHLRFREAPVNFNAEVYPTPMLLSQMEDYEPAPTSFITDQDGFVVSEKQSRAVSPEKDALKLVYFGGSTTECMYVASEKRFPALSGELLAADLGREVRAYNAGLSGNHSLHSILLLLGKGLPLKPDMALLMHNINDLHVLLFEQSYWNQNPNRSLVVNNPSGWREVFRQLKNMTFPLLFERASMLYAQIKGSREDEWEKVRGRPVTFDPEQLTNAFEKNLRLFVFICRNWDITPVLMTQANRFLEQPDPFIDRMMKGFEESWSISYPEYKSLYDSFNQTIRRVAEEEQVLLIDLDRFVPKEKKYLYDTCHYNEAGSQLAAEIIASALAESLAS